MLRWPANMFPELNRKKVPDRPELYFIVSASINNSQTPNALVQFPLSREVTVGEDAGRIVLWVRKQRPGVFSLSRQQNSSSTLPWPGATLQLLLLACVGGRSCWQSVPTRVISIPLLVQPDALLGESPSPPRGGVNACRWLHAVQGKSWETVPSPI